MGIIRQPLQMTVKTYPAAPKALALSAPTSGQVAVYSSAAINGSGGSANLALLRKLNYTKRKVYRKSLLVVTEQTTVLDAGTATAFLTALNDAVFIGSKDPFGFVGFNVSTAIGAGSTITYTYYNGTSFVTLNTFEVTGFGATGTKYVIFAPPVDWVVGGITGTDSSLYYIKIIDTVAPATPVSFNEFWVAELLAWQEAVADNSGLSIESLGEHKPLILDQGEGLMPYFSVNANLNLFQAAYNINS